MSVRRAQLEIDSAEFSRWVAFYELEPWGAGIEDLRTWSITAMLANVNRNTVKRPQPFELLDFVPWAKDRPGNEEAELILFDDPVAQTNLLRAQLFGRR